MCVYMYKIIKKRKSYNIVFTFNSVGRKTHTV